jgi:hypothetical protein
MVSLYFPDNEMAKLGTVTLSAAIDGKPVGSEEFSQAGSYVFTRDLTEDAVAALDTNAVLVQVCFDKAMEPSGSEDRELGAVVRRIALVSRPNPVSRLGALSGLNP